ncbi:MAG TPA: magnesium transporter CorA family protein [Polyangia bacterium]
MLNVSPNPDAPLTEAVWIDLLEPDDEERKRVEQATKLRLPTKGDLEEIESSSRVFTEGEVAYLSTPVLMTTDCMKGGVTSIGFVLSPTRLITLRFARVTAFDSVVAVPADAPARTARDVFLKLMEAIIEHTADALEHASSELESISRAAFHVEGGRRQRKVARASEMLRAALRKLGRMGDGLSHVRDTLLGLGRIAAFTHDNAREAQSAADLARSKAIRGDITSLNDYQAHLSSKVQFLLDATLGFISIEQNDVVKTLTVVSVVGVPPVLIAGIYGMNFKYMPELGWTFGYPYALALMLVSALLPLAWFKWRGWL